jgi:hypothetical protein
MPLEPQPIPGVTFPVKIMSTWDRTLIDMTLRDLLNAKGGKQIGPQQTNRQKQGGCVSHNHSAC